MKKYFLFIPFIFLLFPNILIANTNIVFIDMDKIMSTSIAGKSILNQLNDINEKRLKDLEKIAKDLKNKEKKLITQKNILAASEYEKNITYLKSQINKYSIKKKKDIDELKELKRNNTSRFILEINTILLKYSEENKISLILHKKNIVLGKSDLDISEDVVKLINIKIKEFKVK